MTSVSLEKGNVQQDSGACSFDKLILYCIKKGNTEKQTRSKKCDGAEIITPEKV